MISVRRLRNISKTYRHFRRYQQIIKVLAKYGLADFLASALPQMSPIRRFSKPASQISQLTRYQRIRLALEELGPTFIKLGQLLSIRTDLIPPSLAQELSNLQDKVPPFSFEQARKIIETELECPLEKIFVEFEPVPVAAASLGQVHKARLRSGELVAVKVQRPRIKNIIETDIEIMLYLASLIEKHIIESKQYNPVGIVNEFGRSITKELNYLLEANNIEKFARNFQNESYIKVPKVYRNYTTSKVLVMEYIEGIKISDISRLKKEGYDCHLLAVRGAKLILKQIFEHNFFHGDPHPGNILILPGNIICFLDYGMMGRLDEETKNYLAMFVQAVVEKDAESATRWLLKLCPSDKADFDILKRELWELIEDYYEMPLGLIEIKSLFKEVIYLVERHQIKIPPNLFLLDKALVALEGIGKKLDPEFNAIEQIKPYIKKLLTEKYHLFNLLKKCRRDFYVLMSLLYDIPRFLGQLTDWQHRWWQIRVEVEHLDTLLNKFNAITNRIVLAIIISALIVGSALLALVAIPPFVLGIPVVSVLGFLLAGFLGFVLFIITLRSNRH